MTDAAKPPILALGKAGHVYVVTDYMFHSQGGVIPLVKHDVTGQFEYICRKKAATEAATMDLSPPEGAVRTVPNL